MCQVLIPYATAGTPDNSVCLGVIHSYSIFMISNLFPAPPSGYFSAVAVHDFFILALNINMFANQIEKIKIKLILGSGLRPFLIVRISF